MNTNYEYIQNLITRMESHAELHSDSKDILNEAASSLAELLKERDALDCFLGL